MKSGSAPNTLYQNTLGTRYSAVPCGTRELSLRQSLSCSSHGRRLMINEWNQLSFINEQFSVADRRVCSSQKEGDSEGERGCQRGGERERKERPSTPRSLYSLLPLPCPAAARLTSSVNNLDFDSDSDLDRSIFHPLSSFLVFGYCAPTVASN